jgi:hypothetical protein
MYSRIVKFSKKQIKKFFKAKVLIGAHRNNVMDFFCGEFSLIRLIILLNLHFIGFRIYFQIPKKNCWYIYLVVNKYKCSSNTNTVFRKFSYKKRKMSPTLIVVTQLITMTTLITKNPNNYC